MQARAFHLFRSVQRESSRPKKQLLCNQLPPELSPENWHAGRAATRCILSWASIMRTASVQNCSQRRMNVVSARRPNSMRCGIYWLRVKYNFLNPIVGEAVPVPVQHWYENLEDQMMQQFSEDINVLVFTRCFELLNHAAAARYQIEDVEYKTNRSWRLSSSAGPLPALLRTTPKLP
jgi:hypothetical protein